MEEAKDVRRIQKTAYQPLHNAQLNQVLSAMSTPTFLRNHVPVPADTTKMVTPALDVDLLAVLEQEKQQRVLQRLIVFVHKMYVLVQMVPLPPELLVLHIMPIFACPVPADTTKMVLPVWRAPMESIR